MATDPEFVEHVRDLFSGLGPIRTGNMFSGTALYIDDAMFAVILNDTVFMKSDDALGEAYLEAGSEPFEYDRKDGRRVVTSLMSLPVSALDDPGEALDWARKSLVPAEAAAVKRAKRKKR